MFTSRLRRFAAATGLFTLFIWANSMVPGTESGGLSLSVVAVVRSALGAFGLPSRWVTNLLVRKLAHMTEYAVLAVLASNTAQAYAAAGKHKHIYGLLVLYLIAVPCIDETIQLFIPGRCGTPVDVLIDCCGAVVGVLVFSFMHRHESRVHACSNFCSK